MSCLPTEASKTFKQTKKQANSVVMDALRINVKNYSCNNAFLCKVLFIYFVKLHISFFILFVNFGFNVTPNNLTVCYHARLLRKLQALIPFHSGNTYIWYLANSGYSDQMLKNATFR